MQQAFGNNFSLQVAYVGNHGTRMNRRRTSTCPAPMAAATPPFLRTQPPSPAAPPAHGGHQRVLPRRLLQLRLAPGPAHQALFCRPLLHLRIYVGQGAGLRHRRRRQRQLDFFINLRRNYAPGDFDRAKNFEQSFNYELPAGRGHAHFNSGVGDAVLGGWRLTGIISLVSGLPFTVTANGGTLNTPGTTQTGSINGSLKCFTSIGPGNQWFDTTNFSQPSGCTATTPCTDPGPRQYRQKPVPWPRLHPGQLLHRQEVHHLPRTRVWRLASTPSS